MRRLILLLALLLAIALEGCGGANTPAPSPQPYGGETAPAPAPSAVPATSTAPTAVATPATPQATPDIQKIVNPQPDDWKQGPDGAKVTIIEWADYQCPYCASAAPLLKRLTDTYPNDVQLVYRYFPLPSHPLSLLSAEAAEAAGAQDPKQFWKMGELLFANQQDWTNQSSEDFRKTLTQYGQQIGLDVQKFNSDLDSGKYKDKVQSAQDLAQQLGLPGTPFLLLNGSPWPQSLSYLSYNNLDGFVKYFVDLPQKQFKAAPAMQIDKNKQYTATLQTDQGDIVVKLFADKAPLAVNNFVFLAKNGWYDGVKFHRVLPDFMAQAGDPSGLGLGGPGYSFPNEVTSLKFDKAGLLAMANAGPDTNGSQFFITYGPAPQLDAADPAKEANYTIFGEVISGMDIARKLTPRDPQQNPDVNGSVIKTITIEEK